jgi:hypothetical protein
MPDHIFIPCRKLIGLPRLIEYPMPNRTSLTIAFAQFWDSDVGSLKRTQPNESPHYSCHCSWNSPRYAQPRSDVNPRFHSPRRAALWGSPSQSRMIENIRFVMDTIMQSDRDIFQKQCRMRRYRCHSIRYWTKLFQPLHWISIHFFFGTWYWKSHPVCHGLTQARANDHARIGRVSRPRTLNSRLPIVSQERQDKYRESDLS